MQKLLYIYLSQPNHTVTGSVRDAKVPAVRQLNKLPTAEVWNLLLLGIENTPTTDTEAVEFIEARGVDHIDIARRQIGYINWF